MLLIFQKLKIDFLTIWCRRIRDMAILTISLSFLGSVTRQLSSLVPRHCLIILSEILLRFIYTLLNLLHLTIVGFLRPLPLIIVLDWLNSIASSNSCVFMQETILRIVWKFVIRSLSAIFLLFSWVEMLSCRWTRLHLFFYFLLTLLKKVLLRRVMKNLLVFGSILLLPLFLFVAPDSHCLATCDLHCPYLISRQVIKLLEYSLQNSDSILINLLTNQCQSVTSFSFNLVTERVGKR